MIQRLIPTLLILLCSFPLFAYENPRYLHEQREFYILTYAYGLSDIPVRKKVWKGWSREALTNLLPSDHFTTLRYRYSLDPHMLGYAKYDDARAKFPLNLPEGRIKVIFDDYLVDSTIYTFNAEGRLTQSFTSFNRYNPGDAQSAIYNKQGECTQLNVLLPSPFRPVVADYTMEYNKKNKLEKMEYKERGSSYRYWYCGDKLDSLIGMRKGKSHYAVRYYYNSSDHLDSAIALGSRSYFSYNRKGKLIRYQFQGDYKARYDVTYEWKKNKIKSYTCKKFYGDELEEEYTVTYEYKGDKVLSETITSSEEETEVITYTYKNNDLIALKSENFELLITYVSKKIGKKRMDVPVKIKEIQMEMIHLIEWQF